MAQPSNHPGLILWLDAPQPGNPRDEDDLRHTEAVSVPGTPHATMSPPVGSPTPSFPHRSETIPQPPLGARNFPLPAPTNYSILMTRIFFGHRRRDLSPAGPWCALQPAKTADSIGFALRPGSGQSEYFTVYGGLQLALGLSLSAAVGSPR